MPALRSTALPSHFSSRFNRNAERVSAFYSYRTCANIRSLWPDDLDYRTESGRAAAITVQVRGGGLDLLMMMVMVMVMVMMVMMVMTV